MLFDVAAFLSTSATLTTVAEAFDVHENFARVSTVLTVDASALPVSYLPGEHDLTAASFGLPQPIIGPQPAMSRVSVSDLQKITGQQLLAQLSYLDDASLSKFVSDYPSSVEALTTHPPAAAQVISWWSGLSVDAQKRFARSAPQLIGNLDGVPFAVRNTANRAVLATSFTTIKSELNSGIGQGARNYSEHQLALLDSVRTALGNSTALPKRSLLTLDLTGEGRAAIAVGNLETADYVSYIVPGMFFGIDQQMVKWTDTASRLYHDETSWLKLFGHKDASDSRKSVAVVAWIGYQTPQLLNVGSSVLANQARDSLTSSITGLKAVRSWHEPYIAILAHSYGSTAALLALQQKDFTVDALALVGSPGSPAKSVKQLHVTKGNVWVGEAAWDPIPNSAFFGSDPGSPSYGAKKMSTAGGIDPITSDVLTSSFGHNNYFDAGTQSLRNMALIAIDKGQFVSDGSKNDASKTLALLK